MFKAFFTKVRTWMDTMKKKYTTSKVAKAVVKITAGAGIALVTYFGFKYIKLKKYLSGVLTCLHQTQHALQVVSAQAAQLTLDNTVLAEFLGMTLGIPAKIYD